MLKVIESNDVVIHGINIEQGIYEDDGPNTDGLAVSGYNIRISDCSFKTGDDCLVIGNTEHLVLSNCTFTTTESAIVLSGLKNGAISNCSIFEAGGAFTIRARSGIIENVVINNINYRLSQNKGGNLLFMRSTPADQVRESVQSWAERWNIEVKRQPDLPPPVMRNIRISDVTAYSDGPIFIDGLENCYIEDVTIENVRYTMRGGVEKPESDNPSHPFYCFGHHTAPYGIFCRYVKDITLKDIKFTWNQPESAEWGSAIRFEHAENIEIDGFRGRQSLGSEKPVIGLKDVKGAYIHNCQAMEGAGTFLEIAEGSENVLFMNSDMREALSAIDVSDNVKDAEVQQSGIIVN